MKHIELTDLHIGDWVQIKMSNGNFSPPVKVVAIFADGFVHTNTSDEQGDSFEDRIEDIYDIELTPQVLGLFKFETQTNAFDNSKMYMTPQKIYFCHELGRVTVVGSRINPTFREAIQIFRKYHHLDPQLEVIFDK